MLVNGASGRDERRFPDPDRLDVKREIEFHLGFGYGRHVCLGAFLARMESSVALEEFFRRWREYDVPEDGHRAHALEQRARLRGSRARAALSAARAAAAANPIG